jgi:hypothetical protein
MPGASQALSRKQPNVAIVLPAWLNPQLDGINIIFKLNAARLMVPWCNLGFSMKGEKSTIHYDDKL